MVEGIAETVLREGSEVLVFVHHIDVAAALGLRHVLGGANELLGEIDQLLHGLDQILQGRNIVGHNVHVPVDVIVREGGEAGEGGEDTHVVINIVAPTIGIRLIVSEGLAQGFEHGSVALGVVLEGVRRKIAEQVRQQVGLLGDAFLVIAEGDAVEQVEQLADILAGLNLLVGAQSINVNGGRAAKLVIRDLQQCADVLEQLIPLCGRPVGHVAVDELADRLQQAAGVEGAAVELVVINGHAPEVLVFVPAEAGSDVGSAAVGEHRRRIADDQLNVLLLVHAVEADGLLQILVHEAEVEVEHELQERDLFIVVFADVERVVVDRQNARAGAGALGVDAEGVLRAVIFRIADDRMPCPLAVCILLAADDGKGLHGVIIGLVLRRTGADGDVELVVELHDLPDGAAVDAVGEVEGRIVKELFLRCDALIGVTDIRRRGRVDASAEFGRAIPILSNDLYGADDEFILINAQAADTAGDALLEASAELLNRHAVDLLALVGFGVDLPDLRRAVDRAAEVELAVVFHGVAEADVLSGRSLGHQDHHFAGLGVDLDQRAAGTLPVFFRHEVVAIINGVQNGGQKLRVDFVSEARTHQLSRGPQGVVEKTGVDPVAVAQRRPGIGLAAVAESVRGENVGVELAIEGIVHNTVSSSGELIVAVGSNIRMGDFFCRLIVQSLILVGEIRGFGLICERRNREQSDYHDQTEQNAQ